jgi:hypothetical protein
VKTLARKNSALVDRLRVLKSRSGRRLHTIIHFIRFCGRPCAELSADRTNVADALAMNLGAFMA